MKSILIVITLLVLSACTTVKPGPEVTAQAERAIIAATDEGGGEFAPVEMRYAREKLASAKTSIEKQKYEVTIYLIEESEINSELAIEKSRAAKVRREASELRKSNEVLEAKLRDTFGADFK
jgi:hypothetical protein